MTIVRLVDGARHGRWLTRERIIAGGQVLLLIELTVLVLLALWQHGVITDQISRTSSDFVSFDAAGKLALAGTPALAYDQAAHFLAELNAIHPFREGNGRTQLSFLTVVAERAGHPLHLERLEPKKILNATVKSFAGDEIALVKQINKLI
jgi:hypothetical protein